MPVAPGQVGTGVVAAQYTRLRDQFADINFRGATSDVGQFRPAPTRSANLDTVIDEPGDTGITSLLGKFWSSWQALSLDARLGRQPRGASATRASPSPRASPTSTGKLTAAQTRGRTRASASA